MKVLLAGPLPNEKKNGGVAVFDYNFALELYKQGYSVKFISFRDGNIDSKIKVYNFLHFLAVLLKFKPDVIISSLAYSFLFIYASKPIKIHLLHGYTNYKYYNYFKCILMHIFDCIIRHRYDYLLSNSKFTRLINDEINNIKSDGIFRIGLDDKKINQIPSDIPTNKSNNVLFVGRIIRDKRVKLIYKAFKDMTHIDAHLTFIGFGNESDWIKLRAKRDPNVSFLGFRSNNEIFKYYQKAKVFISLNPSEPYGITYIEALLNNDFVIAPNTGGQVDILSHFPDRCRLVDIHNLNDISTAIKDGLNKKIIPFSSKYDVNRFSYAKTLNDIKPFMKKKQKKIEKIKRSIL